LIETTQPVLAAPSGSGVQDGKDAVRANEAIRLDVDGVLISACDADREPVAIDSLPIERKRANANGARARRRPYQRRATSVKLVSFHRCAPTPARGLRSARQARLWRPVPGMTIRLAAIPPHQRMSLPPSFAVDLVLKVSGEEGAADAAEVEFKRGLDDGFVCRW